VLQQLESRPAGRVLLKKVFDGAGGAVGGAGVEGVGTGTISGSVGAAAGRGRALGSGASVARDKNGGSSSKTKYVRAIPKAGAVVFGRPRQG